MPEQDLNDFVRGDTWTQKVTLRQDDTPVDLNGDTFWLSLKLNPESEDPDAQKKVVASGADATNGIVYLTLEAVDTDGLTPSRYRYDIQRRTGNKIQTLMYGKVRVVRDITRATT